MNKGHTHKHTPTHFVRHVGEGEREREPHQRLVRFASDLTLKL